MEAKDIIHPEDAKAIKAIKGIPGLEKAIACFMKFGLKNNSRREFGKYDTGRCLELPGIVS